MNLPVIFYKAQNYHINSSDRNFLHMEFSHGIHKGMAERAGVESDPVVKAVKEVMSQSTRCAYERYKKDYMDFCNAAVEWAHSEDSVILWLDKLSERGKQAKPSTFGR